MARVKRGVTTRTKHKRLLDQAKGYYGRRKNTIRIARQAVEKALVLGAGGYTPFDACHVSNTSYLSP